MELVGDGAGVGVAVGGDDDCDGVDDVDDCDAFGVAAPVVASTTLVGVRSTDGVTDEVGAIAPSPAEPDAVRAVAPGVDVCVPEFEGEARTATPPSSPSTTLPLDPDWN